MLVIEVPRMLRRVLAGQGRGLLPLALDMTVPPLALLAMLLLVSFGVVLGWSVVIEPVMALWVLLAEVLVFFVAVTLAWWKFGRDLVSPAQIPALFRYVAGKLPIYARFVVKRQLDWVRSKRDAD